ISWDFLPSLLHRTRLPPFCAADWKKPPRLVAPSSADIRSVILNQFMVLLSPELLIFEISSQTRTRGPAIYFYSQNRSAPALPQPQSNAASLRHRRTKQ